MRGLGVMRRLYLFGGALGLLACGSRTGLIPAEEEKSCVTNEECASENLCELHRCVEGSCELVFTKTCATEEACQLAACEPTTGECVLTRVTEDRDGDGYYAIAPGFAAGDEGACGDDCDDTNSSVHPGATEHCDGVDNDCDGVIDNDIPLLPEELSLVSAVPVASAAQPTSGRRALVAAGPQFIAGYWAGTETMAYPYLRGLDPFSNRETFAERRVSSVNASSRQLELVWTGQTLGASWADARGGQAYDVFFARFDASGNKLGPDRALTSSSAFSLRPDLIFEDGRYLVVFDDRRSGASQVFGQWLSEGGEPAGGQSLLSRTGGDAETALTAATQRRIGLVYTQVAGQEVSLVFRSFDKRLGVGSEAFVLTSAEVRDAALTAVGDAFLVTWDRFGSAPGSSIWGAVLSEDGQLLLEPRPLTEEANFARSHAVLSFGDRFLLVWGALFDQNYDLYARVLGADLELVEPTRQLTATTTASLEPVLALNSNGRVGLLYDELEATGRRAYFTSFGCAAQPGPQPPAPR